MAYIRSFFSVHKKTSTQPKNTVDKIETRNHQSASVTLVVAVPLHIDTKFII